MKQTEQLEHLKMAVEKSGVKADEIVLPEEHDIILRRMRFHYLDWGNETATPILFLHGGGLTAHTWDVVCVDLRRDYHCVALDQRGHGDSEWSPNMEYTLDAQVGDIEAVVDYLGAGKLILVGMSMGGINSIRYAGLHSDRLLGLVIVDVGPDLHIEGAEKITRFTREESELDSVEEFVERAMAFNPRRDPVLLRRSLMHNLRQTPEGRWTWKYDKRHRAKWDLAEIKAQNAKLWDDIPNITCPTLVVRGDHSDVFLDEDAEKMVKVLPDARWVRISNAGHTVQGDNPRDLVAAMRGFFEQRGI